jgi:hypothetical protein
MTSYDNFISLGFNYVQALEALGNGTTAATYVSNSILQMLEISLEM